MSQPRQELRWEETRALLTSPCAPGSPRQYQPKRQQCRAGGGAGLQAPAPAACCVCLLQWLSRPSESPDSGSSPASAPASGETWGRRQSKPWSHSSRLWDPAEIPHTWGSGLSH